MKCLHRGVARRLYAKQLADYRALVNAVATMDPEDRTAIQTMVHRWIVTGTPLREALAELKRFVLPSKLRLLRETEQGNDPLPVRQSKR